MNITVMKFGGTSVADPEKIQRAAARAIAEKKRGKAVVVVVSAPGEMTDELLTLSSRVSKNPSPREKDQLITTGEIVGVSLFAMSCLEQGTGAISLSAAQAGIAASGSYGNADISRLNPRRILRELKNRKIAVVAGFQGINAEKDILSLGRGGSDLTAIMLASQLKARQCMIFSDVRGIYTADPRMVAKARILKTISLLDMIELSRFGAQVMQLRSLEIAKKYEIPIQLRSAFHMDLGTLISPRLKEENKAPVTALAFEKKEAKCLISAIGPFAHLNPEIKERMTAEFQRKKIKATAIETGFRRLSFFVRPSDGELALALAHRACQL
jgi:aspartate kinase